MPHRPGLGAILGIVSENGLPYEGAKVRVVDRTTDRVVRQAITGEDGGFIVAGLTTESDDYLVYVTDETEGEADPENPDVVFRNALIQDRVKPVPIHVGSHYPSRWFSLARRLNPTLLYPGPVDMRFKTSSNLVNSYNAAYGSFQGGIGSFTYPAPFNENGAYNLPCVHLADNTWFRMKGGFRQTCGDHVNTKFSMSMYVDFRTAWGFTQRFADRCNYSIFYLGLNPLITVSFDGSSVVKIELFLNSYNNTNPRDRWTTDSTLTVQKTYDVTISPVPSDWELVSVVLSGGSYLKLFIGGNTYDVDLTTVPSAFSSLTSRQKIWIEDAAFHGYNRAAAVTGPKMAFYMFTHFLMSYIQHAELRDALLNGGFPTEIEYGRSVTTDLPALYYRLNELNTEGRYSPEHYIGDPSNVSEVLDGKWCKELNYQYPNQADPVLVQSLNVGSSAVKFDGNLLFYQDHATVPNCYDFTLEAIICPGTEMWVDPVTELPITAATQQVIALVSDDLYDGVYSTTSPYPLTGVKNPSHFGWYWTASAYVVYLAGSGQTLTFSYAHPEGEHHHIAIVISREVGKGYLYVDGILTFTVDVTTTTPTEDALWSGYKNVLADVIGGTSTAYVDPSQYYRRQLCIGARRLNAMSVNDGFVGSISDFAMYNWALPEFRIKDHFDSIEAFSFLDPEESEPIGFTLGEQLVWGTTAIRYFTLLDQTEWGTNNISRNFTLLDQTEWGTTAIRYFTLLDQTEWGLALVAEE